MNFKNWVRILVALLLTLNMITVYEVNKQGNEIKDKTDEIISLNTIYDEQQKEINSLREEIADLQEQLDNVIVLEYDYDYVVGVVAAEAMNQPVEGQMAVAQVIQNRSEEWNMTPEEVVKQRSQFASPVSKEKVTDEVKESCDRVFLKGEKVTNHPVKWFCTVDSFPKTHMSKTHVFTIADHKFFM